MAKEPKPKRGPRDYYTAEARRLIRQAGMDPDRFTDRDYTGWFDHHIQLKLIVSVALEELDNQKEQANATKEG